MSGTASSVRITKRLVDAMRPGELIWDADVRGFAVRCQTQRKVYVLKTRIGGRQRWLTIGDHGSPWTVDTARVEAQRLWSEIRSGVNLAAMRDARRDPVTVAELCARFLDEHASQHKKPSSFRMDRMNIDNHIVPLLGKMSVIELGREDLQRFMRAVKEGRTSLTKRNTKRGPGSLITGGTGVANRCLSIISKMLNLAEVWDIRPANSNPCGQIERYPENRFERFLAAEEAERLGATLSAVEADGSESPYIVAAIRLLLLTGARAGEILTLQWSHVDLERSILALPDSKTGRKTIFLSAAASEVLKNLPRAPDTPYVVAGVRPGVAITNIHKPWHRIRKLAGINDVRIHDLRHSFASMAAANGASLLMIGKLLGHTNAQTTQRYAHLIADPIKELNQLIGSQLDKVLQVTRAKDDATDAE